MSELRKNTQAYTVGDGSGIAGDCWRTAISCVLDVARDSVPHFVELERDDPDPTRWYTAAIEWLEERGYVMLAGPELVAPRPAPYAIASGMGPRGVVHCVIVDANTGETVWDPHPSRDGLASPDRFEFIVPRSAVPA